MLKIFNVINLLVYRIGVLFRIGYFIFGVIFVVLLDMCRPTRYRFTSLDHVCIHAFASVSYEPTTKRVKKWMYVKDYCISFSKIHMEVSFV